jgi:uncharacterized membrane protein
VLIIYELFIYLFMGGFMAPPAVIIVHGALLGGSFIIHHSHLMSPPMALWE